VKEDIDDAPAALPQLADIRVRTYTIKASGEHTTGVIAQEMLWKHPDRVHMGAGRKECTASKRRISGFWLRPSRIEGRQCRFGGWRQCGR
jgi:hypothetical protein